MYTKDDTRSRDKQGQMARTSVFGRRRSLSWPTGSERCGTRRSSAATPIAPRSTFDRTPPRLSSCSHIHRRRWRRQLTARRRASIRFFAIFGRAPFTRSQRSCSPSTGCACAARSRLGKPRHSGRTQPRERSNAVLAASWLLALEPGGQTEATSGDFYRRGCGCVERWKVDPPGRQGHSHASRNRPFRAVFVSPHS